MDAINARRQRAAASDLVLACCAALDQLRIAYDLAENDEQIRLNLLSQIMGMASLLDVIRETHFAG